MFIIRILPDSGMRRPLQLPSSETARDHGRTDSIRRFRNQRQDFQNRQADRMSRNNGATRVPKLGDLVKVMIPRDRRGILDDKFLVAVIVDIQHNGESLLLATSRLD